MVFSRNRFRNLLQAFAFGVSATIALGIVACDSGSDSDDEHNTIDTSTLTDSTLDTTGGESGALFSIGNIVMKPDGDRTLYVQTVSSLAGPELTSDQALEFHGNSRHWAYNGSVYIGSGEAPTITKLVPDATGQLVQNAQLNFLNQGLATIPAGIAFISPTKAYLFAEREHKLIIWNPTDMLILGEVDLTSLAKEGWSTELWNARVADGRVYVPVRYVDWNQYAVAPEAAIMIIDSQLDTVLGIAKDDRCIGANQPAINAQGDLYVLGDGRNYFAQLAAQMAGQDIPPTCMLRIKQGALEFDPAFHVSLPEQTSRNAATQMWHVGGNQAYLKMYYPENINESTNLEGFNFWLNPLFRLWSVQLGDGVAFQELTQAPFSMVAFGGEVIDGSLYIAEGDTTASSTLFRIDPTTQAFEPLRAIPGALRGAYRLR